MADLTADIGILIIGHGSRDARAVAELEQTAELIADRFVGTAVAFGCLDYAAPTIADGLDALAERGVDTVIAAPALLGAGNHVQSDIPRIVASYMDANPDIDIRLTEPIVGHDGPVAAAADRVRNAIDVADRELGAASPADTALIVVGRGASDAEANAAVARVARLLMEELALAWTETAFAGVAAPTVDEALARAARLGVARLIVLPYLMYGGNLLTGIYEAADRGAADAPHMQVIKAGHLGNHPRIIDTVVSRVAECVDLVARERRSQRPSDDRPGAANGVAAADVPAPAPPAVLPGFDLPPGWKVANDYAAAAVRAALDGGAAVALDVEAGDARWLMTGGLTLDAHAPVGIMVTHKDQKLAMERLVLHPPVLALGIDCPRDARAEEVEITVRDMLRRHGLAAEAVAVLVSIDVNSDAAALHHLAESLEVPLRFFDARALEKQSARVSIRSDASFDAYGCHNVAEAAALCAGGKRARLLAPQEESGRVAVAVSFGPEIDGEAIGRPRGHLWLLGLGPGDAALRAPHAAAILERVDHVVGYGPHIDDLGPLAPHQTRHDFPRSEEVQRCRKALDLAARGSRVALLAGGDPGIYETASIVWELVDDGRSRWRQVSVEVVPGITAMQAAAARVGAPLGTDFCVISLSDILTPWRRIELRLAAAAAGDFVVAIHNPVSRRRTKSFDRAKDILLTSRSPETPVVIARHIGRADEEVTVTALGEVTKAGLDANSVLIVGSTETRRVDIAGRPRVFTPRGYGPAPKASPQHAEQDAAPTLDTSVGPSAADDGTDDGTDDSAAESANEGDNERANNGVVPPADD